MSAAQEDREDVKETILDALKDCDLEHLINEVMTCLDEHVEWGSE